jgi:hypothetical protein
VQHKSVFNVENVEGAQEMNRRRIGMAGLSSSGSLDPAGHRRFRGAWRRAVAVAATMGMVGGMLALGAPAASAAGEQTAASQSADSAAQITRDYVIRYWPRWISFAQQTAANAAAGGLNQIVGPDGMGPQFRIVVAINDDTIYSSGFVDLRQGPVILTVPASGTTYSVLAVDVFGEVIQTGLPSQTPGTYALVTKGWSGTLPAGVTKLELPYAVTFWNFRADKYSPTGQNLVAAATAFRASLRLTTLAKYLADPNNGAATILPLSSLRFSFKVAEDIGALDAPNLFLRTMQRAVHDPTTEPMYPSDLRLSRQFDQAFQAAQEAAQRGNPRPLRAIERAAGQAYHLLVANWKDSASSTKWIHPTNFAEWGTDYLDRASGTEYIQYGNNAAAAGYYHAFLDGRGRELNGATHDYKLTFAADQIPDAERFWSLTMYTPDTVELVPNSADKYLVARYTPGLVYNADGSVTIYMSVTKPANVPAANWLPARRGVFNVMLRVYGPTGNTAPDAGYNPPAITIAR